MDTVMMAPRPGIHVEGGVSSESHRYRAHMSVSMSDHVSRAGLSTMSNYPSGYADAEISSSHMPNGTSASYRSHGNRHVYESAHIGEGEEWKRSPTQTSDRVAYCHDQHELQPQHERNRRSSSAISTSCTAKKKNVEGFCEHNPAYWAQDHGDSPSSRGFWGPPADPVGRTVREEEDLMRRQHSPGLEKASPPAGVMIGSRTQLSRSGGSADSPGASSLYVVVEVDEETYGSCCHECEDPAPEAFCSDCSMVYCLTCSDHLHRKGKLAAHDVQLIYKTDAPLYNDSCGMCVRVKRFTRPPKVKGPFGHSSGLGEEGSGHHSPCDCANCIRALGSYASSVSSSASTASSCCSSYSPSSGLEFLTSQGKQTGPTARTAVLRRTLSASGAESTGSGRDCCGTAMHHGGPEGQSKHGSSLVSAATSASTSFIGSGDPAECDGDFQESSSHMQPQQQSMATSTRKNALRRSNSLSGSRLRHLLKEGGPPRSPNQIPDKKMENIQHPASVSPDRLRLRRSRSCSGSSLGIADVALAANKGSSYQQGGNVNESQRWTGTKMTPVDVSPNVCKGHCQGERCSAASGMNGRERCAHEQNYNSGAPPSWETSPCSAASTEVLSWPPLNRQNSDGGSSTKHSRSIARIQGGSGTSVCSASGLGVECHKGHRGFLNRPQAQSQSQMSPRQYRYAVAEVPSRDADRRCAVCEDVGGDLFCHDCGIIYCLGCSEAFHEKGKLVLHVVNLIQGQWVSGLDGHALGSPFRSSPSKQRGIGAAPSATDDCLGETLNGGGLGFSVNNHNSKQRRSLISGCRACRRRASVGNLFAKSSLQTSSTTSSERWSPVLSSCSPDAMSSYLNAELAAHHQKLRRPISSQERWVEADGPTCSRFCGSPPSGPPCHAGSPAPAVSRSASPPSALQLSRAQRKIGRVEGSNMSVGSREFVQETHYGNAAAVAVAKDYPSSESQDICARRHGRTPSSPALGLEEEDGSSCTEFLERGQGSTDQESVDGFTATRRDRQGPKLRVNTHVANRSPPSAMFGPVAARLAGGGATERFVQLHAPEGRRQTDSPRARRGSLSAQLSVARAVEQNIVHSPTPPQSTERDSVTMTGTSTEKQGVPGQGQGQSQDQFLSACAVRPKMRKSKSIWLDGGRGSAQHEPRFPREVSQDDCASGRGGPRRGSGSFNTSGNIVSSKDRPGSVAHASHGRFNNRSRVEGGSTTGSGLSAAHGLTGHRRLRSQSAAVTSTSERAGSSSSYRCPSQEGPSDRTLSVPVDGEVVTSHLDLDKAGATRDHSGRRERSFLSRQGSLKNLRNTGSEGLAESGRALPSSSSSASPPDRRGSNPAVGPDCDFRRGKESNIAYDPSQDAHDDGGSSASNEEERAPEGSSKGFNDDAHRPQGCEIRAESPVEDTPEASREGALVPTSAGGPRQMLRRKKSRGLSINLEQVARTQQVRRSFVLERGILKADGFEIQEDGIRQTPFGELQAGEEPETEVLGTRDLLIILEELGHGAGGRVYKALYVPTMRLVAVKVVQLADQNKRQQLVRELKSLHSNFVSISDTISLESACPSLVTFYDAFTDPNTYSVSVILEYMDGGSLQDRLDRGGRCTDEDELADIAESVLLGLKFLHDRHQLHRDIKPSNILASRGVPRLCREASCEMCSDRRRRPNDQDRSSTHLKGYNQNHNSYDETDEYVKSKSSSGSECSRRDRSDSREGRRVPSPRKGSKKHSGSEEGQSRAHRSRRAAPRLRGLSSTESREDTTGAESDCSSVSSTSTASSSSSSSSSSFSSSSPLSPSPFACCGGAVATCYKISDFGISKELENTGALASTFTGTLLYMAPERIGGGDYSFPADVWAFGLSLMTLAVGHVPLPSEHGYWGVVDALRSQPAPALESFGDFSPEFCDFIRRCLQKDPRTRATCRELLEHPFLLRTRTRKGTAGRRGGGLFDEKENRASNHQQNHRVCSQAEEDEHPALTKGKDGSAAVDCLWRANNQENNWNSGNTDKGAHNNEGVVLGERKRREIQELVDKLEEWHLRNRELEAAEMEDDDGAGTNQEGEKTCGRPERCGSPSEEGSNNDHTDPKVPRRRRAALAGCVRVPRRRVLSLSDQLGAPAAHVMAVFDKKPIFRLS